VSTYKARMLNFISPLPFYSNLVAYYLIGSSIVSNFYNIFLSRGSYVCLVFGFNDEIFIDIQSGTCDY
jgi:hypothetical protein